MLGRRYRKTKRILSLFIATVMLLSMMNSVLASNMETPKYSNGKDLAGMNNATNNSYAPQSVGGGEQSAALEFINYDNEEFPFAFEILEYDGEMVMISVTNN